MSDCGVSERSKSIDQVALGSSDLESQKTVSGA